MCAGCFGPAQAEKWTITPSVETRATWTDNPSFDEKSQAQADTIFELIPSINVRGEGKRFRISGTVSLDALAYLQGTRDNRLLPSGDLTANFEAIERFFFIEAGIVSGQIAEDVFGPRPNGASDFNTITTTQYRLVPSFEGRFGPDVEWRLRSANSLTDVSGDTPSAGWSYLGEHSLRIQHAPTPLGWGFEAAHNEIRVESDLLPEGTTDSARLRLDYAFSTNFRFGPRVGYETTTLTIDHREQVIYGADFQWRPTERTDLNGLWEERFFGASWRFAFTHRMPKVAWNIGLSRELQSFPQEILTLPATNNVAGLLDAAFTTRYPDPAERSRVVSEVIARQGLPSSLQSQTTLFAQQISIVTARSASIVFLGIRNTVALSAFSSLNEALPNSIFSLIGTATPDVAQEGASLTASHQTTPTSTINLTSSYIRTRGLKADEGSVSKQTFVKLQLTVELTPKTNAFAGARYQYFTSNFPGEADVARERAVFAGVGHRF